MTIAREKVVWIGPAAPAAVGAALESRRLSLVQEADVRRAIALAQHGARAIIVHTRTPDVTALLLELVGPARDAGALVLLLADDREMTHLAEVIGAQAAVANQFVSGMPALHVLADGDAIALLADECLRHDPGPSLETAPRLEPEALIESLDPAHRCLLERALHNMSRAEISTLTEGLTEAKVLRVQGFDLEGRKMAPLVAKVDAFDRIEQEILNTQTFVAPFVLPRAYAPLVRERCVRGANHGVLIGSFLAGARPLDAYLATCDKPGAVITALFDGPLEPWRQNARTETIQLGKAYRDWSVIHAKRNHIDGAYDRAIAQGATVLPPEELFAILDALPPVRVRTRITHGDLQARNIFVLEGPHVLLIDFYSTQHEATMSRDPATLDVTLAFDRKANLSVELVASLYRTPVLFAASEVFADPWRAAIAQVRAQTARDGVTDWEYDVSIACYLQRMARLGVQYETLDDTRIALAYRLASDLVESLRGRTPPASIL